MTRSRKRFRPDSLRLVTQAPFNFLKSGPTQGSFWNLLFSEKQDASVTCTIRDKSRAPIKPKSILGFEPSLPRQNGIALPLVPPSLPAVFTFKMTFVLLVGG